jgi:uncharacterized C2H2 Zn-finger protein
MATAAQLRERWLRFAVGFATMKLDQLREGDWLNLREDLTRFATLRGRPKEEADEDAQVFGVAAWPLPGHTITVTFNHDTIRALQEDVHHFLHYSLEIQAYDDALQRGEDIKPPARTLPEIRVIPWLDWPKGPTQDAALFVHGDLRDLFLLRLVFLLQRDASHIRRCPECGSIFYRVRKQEYCTRRCTNRANMRAWRQGPNGKAQESDANHRRYRARVKRAGSPKAKVARRPRSPQK